MKNKNKLLLACAFFTGVSLSAESPAFSNFKEAEYASIERIFANNTAYIDHVADFVCGLGLTGSFLDIGAGPATITERLSHHFSSTSVIEPNRAFTEIYQAQRLSYHIGNFQEARVEGTYDFILCSHVLYHVSQKEWAPFLRKMKSLLSPHGKALVLMVEPKGKWHALRSSINPNYSCSNQVETALAQENIPYELYPTRSLFKVENYDDFHALVRLFTIEDCYLPGEYNALTPTEKEAVEDKITNFILDSEEPDGSYTFIDEDVYILF